MLQEAKKKNTSDPIASKQRLDEGKKSKINDN